jgi:lysine-N-methylase
VKRTAHPDDLTMRYMQRFHCIGAECEDNCCHGWAVDIDEKNFVGMKRLTALRSAEERRRWAAAVTKREQPNGQSVRMFKLEPDGRCPMLEESGLCHVQGEFSEKQLSDTCALYPRRIQVVGEAVELSGMVSCPEMAREVLLRDDATEPETLDRGILPRLRATHGMDPRDVRPYWRQLLKVREFVLGLLRRPGYTLEQRLFFIVWFAKRTAPILNQDVMKADLTPVFDEMKALDDDAVLGDLARRYDAAEASSAVVLILARELVRVRGSKGVRRAYRELIDGVFGEYQEVRVYMEGDTGATDGDSHAGRLWAEYSRRRARILARQGARVEQYLVNVAHNYWMHRLPLEAPDLMVHMLRLLALLAVLKFLLFSHPRSQADGDDRVARLDAVAVQSLYNTARHIEHGPMLTDLEKALERANLRSLAGAICLIRF